MKRELRDLRVVLAPMLMLGLAACASASPPPSLRAAPGAGEAIVGRACPELQHHSNSVEGVLVEMANVSTSTTISDLSRPVQAKQVAKALVTSDQEVDSTWITSSGKEVPLGLKIPRLPSDSSSSVAIEIAIGKKNPQQLHVQAQNQQPTVLPAGDGRSVAVTPYFIFAPKTESLKTYWLCVRRQNEATH